MPWLPDRLPADATSLWQHELPGDGVGGIAVAGGLVILGCRDPQDMADVWVALDADTGQQRWQFMYPAAGMLDYGNSPRATPLVAGGLVYLLGAFGHLHAIDPATGLMVWQKNLSQQFVTPRLEWGLTGSPLLVDGKVIVQPGGRTACLVALDPKTGEVLWKTEGGPPGHASFIAAKVAGKWQLIGYDAESLGGWSAADGTRLWTVKPRLSGDFNVPTPILLDKNRLFVCTENNGARIYRFDDAGLLGPNPIASTAHLNPDSHTPVASLGRIYGLAGGLQCLDVADNLREVWLFDDDALGDYASLIACDRRLLAYTTEAELLLLEDQGESCRVLSRLKLDPDAEGVLSHPALVGTRLYVRTGARVVCLELGEA